MSKKKKRNRQLAAAYRQELQAITSGATVAIHSPTQIVSPARPQTIVSEDEQFTPPAHWRKEIAHTLISAAAMSLLLVAVAIVSHRTSYLGDFGDRLYRFFRLNSG